AGKSIGSILGGIQKGGPSPAGAAIDFGAPSQPDMPPAVPPPVPPPAEPAADQGWTQSPQADATWGQAGAPGQPAAPAQSAWQERAAPPGGGWSQAPAAAESGGQQPAAPAQSAWGTGTVEQPAMQPPAADAAPQWGNLDAGGSQPAAAEPGAAPPAAGGAAW